MLTRHGRSEMHHGLWNNGHGFRRCDRRRSGVRRAGWCAVFRLGRGEHGRVRPERRAAQKNGTSRWSKFPRGFIVRPSRNVTLRKTLSVITIKTLRPCKHEDQRQVSPGYMYILHVAKVFLTGAPVLLPILRHSLVFLILLLSQQRLLTPDNSGLVCYLCMLVYLSRCA